MSSEKNEHTPGPWVVSDCDFAIRSPGLGYPRENIANPYIGGKSLREREANARLIAAAPELLEALQGVLDILGRAESNASGSPEWDYVGPRVAAARAAIAKATGEA